MITALVLAFAALIPAQPVQAGSATDAGRAVAEVLPSNRQEVYRLFAPLLPVCEYEDSANCRWDAGTAGNGAGFSFIDLGGEVYYQTREGETA